MNTNDLLKLARSGYFQVIRIRKVSEHFEIKRLKALMMPVWVVWYNCRDKSEFRYLYDSLLSKGKILDVTKEFTTSDLNRIQEQGFTLIRKYDHPICIKLRDKQTGRWKVMSKFGSITERNYKIDELLNDNYTLLL